MLGWLAILRLLCSDLNVLHPSQAADVTRACRQQVLSLSVQVYQQVEQPCAVAAAPEHHPPARWALLQGLRSAKPTESAAQSMKAPSLRGCCLFDVQTRMLKAVG